MLLPTIRPRNDRLIQSILHQVSLRHASRSAKSTKKSLKPTSSSSSAPAVKKADRASPITSNASTVTSDVASTSASETAVAEHFVKEKVIYELSPDANVVNARLLLGFGLMFCIFCINGADIVRREPKQPTNPDDPRMEGWPAWKRWGGAAGFTAVGLGIGAYCVYWPTRILKKMTLVAPASNPSIQIPTIRLSKGGMFTTPYHECTVRFTTAASELAPGILKAPTVPFSQLRLLGPLASQQKWYHPKGSAAFAENVSKGGKWPSNVPLAIEGTKISFNLRKAGGIFEDPEGLERALLMNDANSRVEEPKRPAAL